MGILADSSAFVRADGVKVPEQNDAEAFIRLGSIAHYLLAHVLSPAVGVGAPCIRILIDGYALGYAVDRCGGAEDELLYSEFLHRFKERQRCIKVIAVIGKRH